METFEDLYVGIDEIALKTAKITMTHPSLNRVFYVRDQAGV